MKKKLLLSLLTLCLTYTAANADSYKVHVAAIENFNTAEPTSKMAVKVIEEANLGSYNLKPNDILYCNVIKVTDPKRGKRAATFAVCPTSYNNGEENVKINDNFYGKYSAKVLSKEEIKNIDAMKVGKKAAVSVGNHFVKGVAPAISLAEGMVKNEDGNRIESGVKQVYKDSPLSYVEKGAELQIKPDDKFYFVFKPSKSKNSADIAEEVLDEE